MASDMLLTAGVVFALVCCLMLAVKVQALETRKCDDSVLYIFWLTVLEFIMIICLAFETRRVGALATKKD